MKKLSFLFVAAVIMMTSCSNDEVVDVAPTPAIGFNTFMNNSTRATETQPATDLVDGTTFNSFDVWAVTWDASNEQAEDYPAVQVFNKQAVSLSDGDWTYSPDRYWIPGNNYRFTALAPSAAGAEVTQNTENLPKEFDAIKGGLNITFDNEAAGAGKDLCIATTKLQNVEAQQDEVHLQFSHMLSRIKFTFQNNFAAQQELLKISEVRITDATQKASINTVLDEKSWTLQGGGTFTINFGLNPAEGSYDTDVIRGGGNTQDTKHQYIFPLTEAKVYTVAFTVELIVFDSGSRKYTSIGSWDHSVALPSTQYKSNYSYNFIAKIDGTNVDPEQEMFPIRFDAEVTPWTDFNADPDVNPDQQISHTHTNNPEMRITD